MNRIKKYLFMLFLLVPGLIYGQCNQELIEIAAEEAGSNAIYIRDFKVKLSKGTMDEPNPTGKFSVYLNKDVNYRFSIANAAEFDGKAFVELFRKGQSFASNHSGAGEEYKGSFDFNCHKSGMYQLRINFGSGKQGCAAVVVSMVYTEAMEFIEPGITQYADSTEILYLWGANKIQVASSKSRNAEIRVSVSQGKVEKRGRYYLITPEQKGELVARVEVYEKDTLLEADSLSFQVVLPPLPDLSFGFRGATEIYRSEIDLFEEVYLTYQEGVHIYPYTLKSFSISEERTGFNRTISSGGKLSYKQVDLLMDIKEGGTVYFHDVIFEDPDGKIHKAKVIEKKVFD